MATQQHPIHSGFGITATADEIIPTVDSLKRGGVKSYAVDPANARRLWEVGAKKGIGGIRVGPSY